MRKISMVTVPLPVVTDVSNLTLQRRYIRAYIVIISVNVFAVFSLTFVSLVIIKRHVTNKFLPLPVARVTATVEISDGNDLHPGKPLVP